MSIVSFNNKNSGKAIVRKAALEHGKVTISFEMEGGRILRESYRLHQQAEVEQLKNVVNALLGHVPFQFDTEQLIGLPCIIKLEERPWKGDQAWLGVAEVSPCTEEKGSRIKREAVENGKDCGNFFDEG